MAKDTVLKLLVDAGDACTAYLRDHVVDVPAKRVQCDEIWSFVHCKQKNVPEGLRGQIGVGDTWTWVAIDADSKLVISWLVGSRNVEHAISFMNDLAGRLAGRIQLTTDGYHPYGEAVGLAFYDEPVDFARLVKLYGAEYDGAGRYSPPRCIGSRKRIVRGEPDPVYISTSYAERQNLSMRMGMRRFTRLTNAFSKKIENLEAAIALYFMHYNFVRRHETLRMSPALKAGLSRRCGRSGISSI